MTIEYAVVLAYLLGCSGIGILASRKVLASRDEYWVAGRRIGTGVNAVAIMATLASGGVAALLAGTIVYLAVQYTPGAPPLSAILLALPASVVAMWMGGRYGRPPRQEIVETITRLHA
jgi:Na+/proline symporter